MRTAMVVWLGVLSLASLSACGGSSSTSGGPDPCQGPACPLIAGDPVTVATPSSDGVVYSLTLAQSPDGKTIAVGWNELSDKASVHSAASTDSGATFGPAIRVDSPPDMELSYINFFLPGTGGMLAGVVVHYPDPMEAATHSWPRVYRSTDSGASFKELIDLKEVTGERSFTHGDFAGSSDGKTLVWAWVDTTPAGWLGPDSAPAPALLASISSDSGKTFEPPQVVSLSPFVHATRVSAFVRDGRAGVVYAEERDLKGLPAKVGAPALALADDKGSFQEPVVIAPESHWVVPVGGAVGTDGAAPGAAVGADGSIHVVWWSALTVGLWHTVSQDAATFSEPVRVLDTATPSPANVRVAVDGSGAAWVAALDKDAARVVQIPSGQDPVEIPEATAPLGGTGDAFDITGLSNQGALQLWLGAPDEEGGAQSVYLRRIAP